MEQEIVQLRFLFKYRKEMKINFPVVIYQEQLNDVIIIAAKWTADIVGEELEQKKFRFQARTAKKQEVRKDGKENNYINISNALTRIEDVATCRNRKEH